MIDRGENCSNEDGAMNLGDLTERAEKLRWSDIIYFYSKDEAWKCR